jgi:hypothetical protein
MKPMAGRSMSLFAWMLRLYPRAFREKFGADMLLDFSDMAAEAEAGGTWRLVSFVLAEMRDLPVEAARLHLKEDEMSEVPGMRRNALRAGAAFGLAFMVMMTFESILATATNDHGWRPLVRIALFLEKLLPQGAWAQTIFYCLGLVCGAALAGVILSAIFADPGRLRIYVVATLACWAAPMAVVRTVMLLLRPQLVDVAGELYLAAIRLILGIGFGILFIWILGDWKHAWRVMAVAVTVYFAASMLVHVLVPLLPFSEPFAVSWNWNIAAGAVLMWLEGTVTGAVLGALAGIPQGNDRMPAAA